MARSWISVLCLRKSIDETYLWVGIDDFGGNLGLTPDSNSIILVETLEQLLLRPSLDNVINL